MLRATVLAAALAAAGQAHAQAAPPSFLLEPYVSATLTATDNSSFEQRGNASSDTILTTGAGFSVRARGAHTKIDGRFGFDATHYLQNTREDRVLPNGALGLNSELVDNWVYVDASLLSQQTSRDVLAARTDNTTSFNRISLTRYQVAPYVERDLSPTMKLQARTDQSWTRSSGEGATSETDAHVQRHLVRIEDKPHPLGWSAEFSRDDTRYRDQDDSALVEDTLRVTGSYLIDEQFQLGAVVGSERIKTIDQKESSTLYGLDAAWRPDPRTDLSTRVERRSFGTGWEGKFAHRTPFYAFNIGFSRQPTTYAQTLGTGARGGNIAQLLDAMLTTRYPDPNERARLVADLIARQGLPTSLGEPLSIVSSGAQLSRAINASVVFNGTRHTLSFSFFSENIEALQLDDDSVLAPARDRTQQRGLAVEFNRRLTPLTSLALLARFARTETQTLVQQGDSREKQFSATITTTLGPSTTASAGLRRQSIKSTTAGDADETALVAGINHRF